MAAVTTPFASDYGIHHAFCANTRNNASAFLSSAIDTSGTDANYATLIVSATLAGVDTVDVQLTFSDATGGTYDKPASSAGAITQITATGSEQITCPIPQGHPFIKTESTVAGATGSVYLDILVLTHKRVKT